MILDEYIPILITIGFASILSCIIYIGSYIIAFQKGDTEKVSPYECGFDPFQDARQKFQVKFYLVGILFLIFDLEVIYLFPWAISLHSNILQPIINYDSLLNYSMVTIFLLILTIGFVYEWKKGALEWE